MRRTPRSIGICFLLLVSAVASGNSQQTGSTAEGTRPGDRTAANPVPVQEITPTKSRELLRQDHEALLKDTERLAELANELKAEVAITPANTLSVGSIRKAQEIDKLAKKIKNRLKS